MESEDHQGADIVIVDDEPIVCETICSMLEFWGMTPRAFDRPRKALKDIRKSSCDLVLLDLYFPDASGFDVMPIILRSCPECKVIIMTGYADKENAIKALKLGAFDFLEKPFAAELLRSAISRALEAKENESRLKRLVAELQQSESDLLVQKQQLQTLNERLLETNKAMTILAQNISREREETEAQTALKLRTMVMPIVNRLADDRRFTEHMKELDFVLAEIIQELSSGMSMDSRMVSALSYTELRIASLIKSGLTTNEIAKQLHVSPSTIKTHRRNIRKKLNISHDRINLRGFLQNLPENP